MTQQPKQSPTLAQRLQSLPLSGVTYHERDGIWTAYYTSRGTVQACELGADTDGLIAQEQRKRKRLARYSPATPLPKYSRAEPEPTCGHGEWLAFHCPTCREKMIERGVVRVARRERTA